MHELAASGDVLRLILDSMYEGIVLVDSNARIVEINQAYLKLLSMERDSVIGRHVAEVIENTRLHRVVETGIPERGQLQRIRQHDMVVHRIPIWQGGKVIGAIGVLIFESIRDLYEILDRLQEYAVQVRSAYPETKQRAEVHQMRRAYRIDDFLGQSRAVLDLRRIARKAAHTPVTVLITGESGTGKEVLAQGIHFESSRANGPFVSVNCSAIPESLLEAELFGYDEGAFTGAKRGGKPGQIELAHMGTLFLDEIGDMPLSMQAKLLRVLEDRQVQRVGGTVKREVNLRLISATNRDLERMVKEGQFREDLYYRLNIIRLHIPPLRERKEDIPLLLAHYLDTTCERLGKARMHLSSEVVERLLDYDWPGNVRELVHMVEVLVSLCDSSYVKLDDFPPHLHKLLQDLSSRPPAITSSQGPAGDTVSRAAIEGPGTGARECIMQVERELIRAALRESGGNKSLAAKRLGVHRSTLYDKMKKLGIL
ncbi:sigma-54 interaction domain-containing protein [Alicyclobacillus sendaiensis]|uniref:sigma-54 interaction domain-containing protein n=1 Tax=Alicyclobacillus sendaiensis TaxID=192387 RepID=UPI0007811D2E|nr:sigma 54-interacting transcriptional regulator [Alicyclobacillus sendaiensis]